MSTLKLIKCNLNGGEISPHSVGRTDLEKYGTWCEKMVNWTPMIQGGVTRRPGMRFIVPAMGPSRLIPFIFSLEAAYMLEFGNGFIRFYTNQAQIVTGAPSWNVTVGGHTTDNTVVWVNAGTLPWPFHTAVTLGQEILDNNGNIQRCGFPGTTGTFTPTWATVVGQFTVDGGALWTNLGPPGTWQPAHTYSTGLIPILDTNGNLQFVFTPGVSNSGAPYQITSPYNTATDNLWDIKFAQIGNTMYLVHPNHPPQKLTRLGDTNWILTAPGFYAPPTKQFDQSISGGTVTLTLSGTGPAGSSVTATASAPIFIEGDIGKGVVAPDGVGVGFITALGGATSVDPTTGATLNTTATLLVIDPYTTASLGTTWLMRGSPGLFLAFGSIGAGPLWIYTRKRGAGGQVDGYTFLAYPVDGLTPPPQHDAFRTQDLGSYIIADGAVLQINQVVTSSHIKATQITTFSTIVGVGTNNVQVPDAASGGEWTIELPSFTSTNGYPRAIAFAQDRLWLASTNAQPQTLWASAVDDFENFGKGVIDSNALAFTVSSGRFEPILWMQAFQGSIVAGTYAGEYLINGGGSGITGNGATITPTNINVLLQSTYGSTAIQPLVVQNDLIYIQRAKKTCYQFTFNIYQSVYASKNLNIYNDQVTTSGLKEMVYAETPFFQAYFTDNSNNLIGLVYEKMNDVWGWCRKETGIDTMDGVVSVATIPTISAGVQNDEVWFVTQRTLNGLPVYCIEIQDLSINLDCASHTVFAIAVSQVGNLGYLQGRKVTVVADGVVLPEVVMDGTGIYHFPPSFSAFDVSVGLNYSADLTTVRPEYTAGGQTIQGLLKGWDVLFARMYNTVGLTLNGQEMSFRTPGADAVPENDPEEIPYGPNLFGQAVIPFTGDIRILNLGNDRDGRLLLSQPQPLPATVVSLFGQITVGNM